MLKNSGIFGKCSTIHMLVYRVKIYAFYVCTGPHIVGENGFRALLTKYKIFIDFWAHQFLTFFEPSNLHPGPYHVAGPAWVLFWIFSRNRRCIVLVLSRCLLYAVYEHLKLQNCVFALCGQNPDTPLKKPTFWCFARKQLTEGRGQSGGFK